ncbi:DUF4123 domain-containing protein [Myxococcus sp. CA033]|nr:DUF4123 domain-containing protein [Myxococcus sp. CA033]
MSPRARHLSALLWAAPEEGSPPLERYALLDAARESRVYSLIRWEPAASCLYEGRIPAELAEVAPYLVRLRPDAPLLGELIGTGWGRAWGLYVEAPVAPELLRRHFRRFLKVQDERGKRLYFRYYDPRVLRTYLPTCNAEELQFVFGPVRSFLMEDEEGSSLLRFSLRDGELLLQRVPLLADTVAA